MNKELEIITIEDWGVAFSKTSAIIEGDYAVTLDYNKDWPPKVVRYVGGYFGYETLKGEPFFHAGVKFGKVIATYNRRLEGIPLIVLPDNDIEKEATQWAMDYYSEEKNPEMDYRARMTQRLGAYNGYQHGYKAALQENKKWNDEDILNAYRSGYRAAMFNHKHLLEGKVHPDIEFHEEPDIDDYIQSLQKIPKKVAVEGICCNDRDVNGDCMEPNCNGLQIKTTSTPEGEIIKALEVYYE